jgi:hypothetical protein
MSVAIITSRVHDDHMTQMVVHQPRVAWDGARAFIRAAASEHYKPFADQVFAKLGQDVFADYEHSRERIFAALTRVPDDRSIIDVEAGKWRVKLEDLLRYHPDLVTEVRALTDMASHY